MATDLETGSQTRALWSIARHSKGAIFNRGLVLALGLVAADVLLIAALQQPSALAVLRYTPPITLLTGVFVNVAAVLYVPLVIVLVMLSAVNATSGRIESVARYALSTVGVVLAGNVFFDASLSPDPQILAIISIVVILTVVAVRTLMRRYAVTVDRSTLAVMVLAIGFTAATASVSGNDDVRAALARPFIPAERLEITEGGDVQVVVAYVLDVDPSGQWSTLLRDDDRTIMVTSSASIVSRIVCRPTGVDEPRARWPLLTSRAGGIPACGDGESGAGP